MNIADTFSSLTSTFSRLFNPNTRLGSNRDAIAATQIVRPCQLSQYEIEALYSQFWLIRRVCDLIPDLATNNGGTFTLGGEANTDIIKEVNSQVCANKRTGQSLRISEFFKLAQQAANRTGGAAILICFDDGDWNIPVKQGSVIAELRLFDRWQVVPDWQGDYNTGKLEPDYYRFYGTNQTTSLIHNSRVLPFYGDPLPLNDIFNLSSGWRGDSVIRKLFSEVITLEASKLSVADKLQRFAVIMLQMQDLVKGLGASASQSRSNVYAASSTDSYETKVRERAENLATAYSNLNVVITDKDRETVENLELKFAGVKENLEFLWNMACAATGLPKFLLGDNFGGNLGSLNEGERSVVAQLVESERRRWDANLNTLLEYYLLSQGHEIDDWEWQWHPIWEDSPKEKAEVEEIQARTIRHFVEMDSIIINSEANRRSLGLSPILTGSEIRNSVFGGAAYGGTRITLESEPIEPISHLADTLDQLLDGVQILDSVT